MHVDHIVPRSVNPAKALDPGNLQVLCERCNLGKFNRDNQDFRPRRLTSEEIEEIEIVTAAKTRQ